MVTVSDEYLRTFYTLESYDIDIVIREYGLQYENLYLVHWTECCSIGLRTVTVYGTECFHGWLRLHDPRKDSRIRCRLTRQRQLDFKEIKTKSPKLKVVNRSCLSLRVYAGKRLSIKSGENAFSAWYQNVSLDRVGISILRKAIKRNENAVDFTCKMYLWYNWWKIAIFSSYVWYIHCGY